MNKEHKKVKKQPVQNIRTHSYLAGRNSVEEILKHSPQRIEQVLIARSDSDSKGSTRLDRIIELTQVHDIPLIDAGWHELTALLNYDSHQGIAVQLKAKDTIDLKEWIKPKSAKNNGLILMLDSISDPQNFGALIRAAECFAAEGVIWSKNRGCDITPTVSKAAVGATELVDLIPVSNLAQAVEKIKESDYWVVVADDEKDGIELSKLEFPAKTLIIMGSEGNGVQPLLVKLADFKVRIPMFGKISSLNVSQATAVMLAEYRRQHGFYINAKCDINSK